MSFIKNFFKRLFRKPAIVFVTIWANWAYNEGVRAAEERRIVEMSRGYEKGNNCMVYLARNSFRPDHLVTYTKRQFKAEKRVYGVAARLLSMNSLKRGCYYHTADRWGADRMTDAEINTRRKAFVKERLRIAKLI
jgi:hypothetical protein